MFRSTNPILTRGAFAHEASDGFMGNFSAATARRETMTVQGAATAGLILVGITAAVAALTWGIVIKGTIPVWPAMIPGIVVYMFGSLIVAIKPRIAPVLAPILAIFLGVFVGAASVAYSAWAQAKGGIGTTVGTETVLQASALTFGIFIAMLAGYAGKVFRPGRGFVAVVCGLAFAWFFAAMAISMLNWFIMPGLWSTIWASPLGLVIAGGVVVLASLMLLVDIKMVDELAQAGAPKHMEWVAGFALLTTLVWLYISLLRLLAILANRD